MNQMRTRRSGLWWALFAAFLLMPIVEIYFIVQVGRVIGVWWTILLLILDGILGTWLVKREGSRTWVALRTALQEGRMPARELADGILILVGGTLMLAPGFVSDFFALFLILPFTRPLGRVVLANVISKKLLVAYGPLGGFAGGDGKSSNEPKGQPSPDVVQGEVVEEDESG
jgi:UPF0716 protein FxsA